MGWIWLAPGFHDEYIKSLINNIMSLYKSGSIRLIISFIEFSDCGLMKIELPKTKIEIASHDKYWLFAMFLDFVESIEKLIIKNVGHCQWKEEIPLDPSFGILVCRNNVVIGEYMSIVDSTTYEFKPFNDVLTQLNRI